MALLDVRRDKCGGILVQLFRNSKSAYEVASEIVATNAEFLEKNAQLESLKAEWRVGASRVLTELNRFHYFGSTA
jgi:hypothetical protein